ncbi:MAG TPA: acetoacetate--CoA ligase, partial [Gemmatimonadaceae bacterium]|nr:acetoacetate--CoA ligase [Gemmatimonadaceae bacterium]
MRGIMNSYHERAFLAFSLAVRVKLRMLRFFETVHAAHPDAPRPDAPYAAWHAWSCTRPAEFWSAVWRFAGVIGDERADGSAWDSVVDGFDRMAPPDPALGPRWFRGARLNFAENLLRHRGSGAAVIFRDERGTRRELDRDALRAAVERVAGALRAVGIRPGDRVAGFLPNIPEAVIAMLAAASCGAVWSSCSPDFGAAGVLERFGQIAPRVLFVADGYRYGGKEIASLERVRDIVAAIPAIEHVVVVPFLRASHGDGDLSAIRAAEWWSVFAARGAGVPLRFERLPFDHPLYVMYSSGTTGLPKCIVHGAGGTLLQHLKEHQLHTAIVPGERVFYFTTCGWMMWNWLVSALASGAALVLYDGSPMPPGAPDALWTMAAEERVSVFGTSAKYIALCEKHGVEPAARAGLGALRLILSTGSPLPPGGYDYVDRAVKPGVRLSSISGGTDIISCFALGNPMLPVYRGELQCRGLGMAVEIFDPQGRPLRGAPGELVCTRPFPSMPVGFWNDPGHAKYRAAYFEFFPGVWRHGDWAEITAHDGVVIHGRSDATLNPGGVRIGTAEIYRQVERFDEVLESVVVAQQVAAADEVDERIVLFVRLRPGLVLDDGLRDRIRARIRSACSPHHVPRVIAQVADIPRTLSGKITEIAVRDVIHGRPVINTDALA